jgi:hypothetical protein
MLEMVVGCPAAATGVGMGTCVRACAGSPVDSTGKWRVRGGRIGRASLAFSSRSLGINDGLDG